jgi:hypothetical protein
MNMMGCGLVQTCTLAAIDTFGNRRIWPPGAWVLFASNRLAQPNVEFIQQCLGTHRSVSLVSTISVMAIGPTNVRKKGTPQQCTHLGSAWSCRRLCALISDPTSLRTPFASHLYCLLRQLHHADLLHLSVYRSAPSLELRLDDLSCTLQHDKY